MENLRQIKVPQKQISIFWELSGWTTSKTIITFPLFIVVDERAKQERRPLSTFGQFPPIYYFINGCLSLFFTPFRMVYLTNNQSLTHTNWVLRQPNNWKESQDCVVAFVNTMEILSTWPFLANQTNQLHNGQWNDIDCNESVSFAVCQMSAF